MGGKSFKDILWKIFRFVFLGFMALISVGPLVWIVMSPFKSNKEILSSAFALPTSLSFNGYKAALDLAPIIYRVVYTLYFLLCFYFCYTKSQESIPPSYPVADKS